MILDTAYTPTHVDLFHRFLLPTATQHGLTVRSRALQAEVAGEFDAAGLLEVQLAESMRLLFSEPCTGQIRMLCGVDIVFLQEWPNYCREYMQQHDYTMAFAWDGIDPCMDFIVFRDCIEARKHLLDCHWMTFLNSQNQTPMGASHLEFVHNQPVNSQVLEQASFNWGCFPHEVVCNWRAVEKDSACQWAGKPFAVPPEARAFHANWTIGVRNKTNLLSMVMEGRS